MLLMLNHVRHLPIQQCHSNFADTIQSVKRPPNTVFHCRKSLKSKTILSVIYSGEYSEKIVPIMP